ncbi:MAG: hypothetical protein HYR88_18010, partial [Verrucomicrobia bacterium]|nr:hypothetical protein [Verrucomicrobiota bacterium]
MKANLLKQLISISLPLIAAYAANAAGTTTIGSFTGGDEGEGLDLQGVFVYAVNIGTVGEAGQAGDAFFTADDVDGFTINASQQIPNWHNPNYGDSSDDDVIETVMKSIRWSPAPETPKIRMTGLAAGATYKLQLLFAEQCCAGRGFNIVVNGEIIATDFKPAAIQGGAGVTSQGVVVAYEYVSAGDTLDIVLDGPGATDGTIVDHNAIINGLTLERTASPGDDDNDGLPDAWEKLYFGNLDQTGSGDPDGDGLTNAQELAAGANPLKADSDGDGLSDGDERQRYHTDPVSPDTDGDGLSDLAEVQMGTSPLKRDTDGDGLSDRAEVRDYRTDPLRQDTDGDQLADGVEILKYGTNPLLRDTDSDGLTDGQEINAQVPSDPRMMDSDRDGIPDADERANGTDPMRPDTDGDGLSDATERDLGLDPKV